MSTGQPNPHGVKLEYENTKLVATSGKVSLTFRVTKGDGGKGKEVHRVYVFNQRTGELLEQADVD